MTCIVALTDGKTVWLGGDAAGTDSSQMTLDIRADPKVSVHEENGVSWGLGFTSSYRMGQLIRYHLSLPPITKKDHEDLFGYMVTKFIPELRDILRQGGVLESKDGAESCGEFIVALMGKIFSIDSDFQVASYDDPFYAVGSGGPFALGAMKALEKFRASGKIDPLTQVEEALAASECFSAGVRRPFTVVTVPYSSKLAPVKTSRKKK